MRSVFVNLKAILTALEWSEKDKMANGGVIAPFSESLLSRLNVGQTNGFETSSRFRRTIKFHRNTKKFSIK